MTASETVATPQVSFPQAAEGARHGDPDVLDLVTAIEAAPIAVPELSVAALRGVLNGIITGEGPTTAGRVHFSRTLDPDDAALCARILESAGGFAGAPVTRREAEVLFQIDAAAAERTDGGGFTELFVKAIAHCALSQAGHRVPPRQLALARHTPLSSWTSRSTGVTRGVLAWIAAQVHAGRRSPATLAELSRLLSRIGAAPLPARTISIDLS